MNALHQWTKQRRKKKNLKIYILRQVNTLDKGFKLSYACKVFHCCWQTIPNFNNTVSKKVLSNIYATLTYKQFTNMPTCCFVTYTKSKIPSFPKSSLPATSFFLFPPFHLSIYIYPFPYHPSFILSRLASASGLEECWVSSAGPGGVSGAERQAKSIWCIAQGTHLLSRTTVSWGGGRNLGTDTISKIW